MDIKKYCIMDIDNKRSVFNIKSVEQLEGTNAVIIHCDEYIVDVTDDKKINNIIGDSFLISRPAYMLLQEVDCEEWAKTVTQLLKQHLEYCFDLDELGNNFMYPCKSKLNFNTLFHYINSNKNKGL